MAARNLKESCHQLSRMWAVVLGGFICAVALAEGLSEDPFSRGGLLRSRLLAEEPRLGVFPFCKCDTYNCACSPYTLTYQGATQGPVGVRYCFTAAYIGCPAASLPCCTALQQRVHKITLSTSADCQKPPGVFKVEVGSKAWLSWETKAWPMTGGGTGYEILIYNMMFNSTTFPGTSICITAKEPCSNIQELCDVTAGTCQFALSETGNGKYCPVCPVAPPSLPPSPPSPPTPPTPCTVCANIFIIPPMNFTPPLYTYGTNVSCNTTAQMMINDLTAASIKYGAVLTVPFAFDSCSGVYDGTLTPPVLPYVTVCGTFRSDADGMKLQAIIATEVLTPWPPVVLSGQVQANSSVTCPINLLGYNSTATVSSPCLDGFSQIACESTLIPLDPAPPPSAPAPAVVQTHTSCPQSTVNVPYVLTAVEVSIGSTPVAMCTTVVPKACNMSMACCKMDFAKVEVVINKACQSSLRYITVDEKRISYSWGLYEDFFSIKFVGLRKEVPNPSGARLCWYVARGACDTPATLCYGGRCQANAFSSDNKCCPANLI